MTDVSELSLEGLKFTTIEVEQYGHVLTVRLNRPHRKNAINEVMLRELVYALDYGKQQRDIRVVILAAAGDVFCAGGDLRNMSGEAAIESASNVPRRDNSEGADQIALRIRNLNKPVIAKIQGPVLAGALLMVCNATHAVAAEDAYFCAPEIKRGIWPMMVMAGLFRVMPKRAGLDFVMRGEKLSAPAAAHLGLINAVVRRQDLDEHVGTLAADLASLAPGSMQLGLAAFNTQEDMSFGDALDYLRGQTARCLDSPDAKEGIDAFLEKREPIWD